MPQGQQQEPGQARAHQVVREEMRPTCLLAHGKGGAGARGSRKQAAREAWPAVQQREVEGHQRESRRGVGAGVAASLRVVAGPVGEQGRIRAAATITREVARAVHAGHLLQAPDDGSAQDHAEHHVSGPEAQPAQTRHCEARRPGGERGEPDQPHQQRAAGVDQVHGPPAVGPDPGAGGPVEEQGIGDAPVEIEGRKRRERHNQGGGGQPGVKQPEARGSHA
ncbi:MAG: hypothetical protein KF822_02615 [Steroidobacteraceae bacterium]|nr:hypothetical protein [Steroidobacteraceae bacterium]